MSKQLLLGSVSLIIVSFGVPVAAQQIAPMASVTTQDQNSGVEEITVTARRRAEIAQDTPVAITAFDQRTFDIIQVKDATDLSAAAPNLFVTQMGGGNASIQPFLRGVGQDALGYNSETPIAVYFDDVYLGRNQGGLADLLDFERIEVLRGPQGTLYGRNSTVGAIKYVLRQPDLETAKFVGDITGGSYDEVTAKVSGSMPIVKDVLAVKVDLSTRNQQGYLDGVNFQGQDIGQHANGIHRDTGRIAALWAPVDGLKLELAGDLNRDHSGSATGTPLSCPATAGGYCTPFFGSAFKTGINSENDGTHSGWGLTGKAEYTADWGSIKSITGDRGFTDYGPVDLLALPGIPLPINIILGQHQLSEELQVLSPSDQRLTWVGGLFFFREEISESANFLGAHGNADHQISDSYAAFGEANYEIIDNVRLTVGGRITSDSKTDNRRIFSPLYAATPFVNTNVSFNATQFTPKVGIDYKMTPDILAYFTYSEGYKPGGFASTWPGSLIEARGGLLVGDGRRLRTRAQNLMVRT